MYKEKQNIFLFLLNFANLFSIKKKKKNINLVNKFNDKINYNSLTNQFTVHQCVTGFVGIIIEFHLLNSGGGGISGILYNSNSLCDVNACICGLFIVPWEFPGCGGCCCICCC